MIYRKLTVSFVFVLVGGNLVYPIVGINAESSCAWRLFYQEAIHGYDINHSARDDKSFVECQALCRATDGCRAVTWSANAHLPISVPPRCYLKSALGVLIGDENARSAAWQCEELSAPAPAAAARLLGPTSFEGSATTTRRRLQFVGVNQAGAEFGFQNLPGSKQIRTRWPEPSGSSSYFVNKGFNLFRLPFRWERLQHRLGEPFDTQYLADLKLAVNTMTQLGASVILDPHNFARYHGRIIGSRAVTIDAFAHFWWQLAQHFRSNTAIIFGLMTEPHSMNTDTWLAASNAAIAAIRSAGATQQLILVPGNGWSGAHSWLNGTSNFTWYGKVNGKVMLDVHDPEWNYAYDMHQYFDKDFSGKTDVCNHPGEARDLLKPATEWLRNNGRRALLGEFGAGTSEHCLGKLREVLSHMADNAEQWIGFAWWAAGPWWGDYFMSLERNEDGSDKAQMRVLEEFLN